MQSSDPTAKPLTPSHGGYPVGGNYGSSQQGGGIYGSSQQGMSGGLVGSGGVSGGGSISLNPSPGGYTFAAGNSGVGIGTISIPNETAKNVCGNSVIVEKVTNVKAGEVNFVPPIHLLSYDTDDGAITLTLAPERTITAFEMMQIQLMLTAETLRPRNMNIAAFVRKNNLERHFTFKMGHVLSA